MEYTILKTLYHPEMKTAGIGKMVPAVYFNVLAKQKKQSSFRIGVTDSLSRRPAF